MEFMNAASAKPAGASPVKDVTTASFRADVLEASLKRPVIVDFWAPWCGPCKQLAPALERAVAAAGGAVTLVKMNIDDHPGIAGQLGVQSIPAVVAFVGGRPADGFVGVLPEGEIKAFIARLTGPGEAELDLQEAEAALEAGDAEGALALAESLVRADPADAGALSVFLRALIALGQSEAATEIFQGLAPEIAADKRLAQVAAAVALAGQAAAVGDDAPLLERLAADPNDHQARFDLALALNARGDREGAADALLRIIRADRSWDEDGARRQLLQFFESWGPLDAATKAARRKLSASLFS